MSKKIISTGKAPQSRSMGPHVKQVIPSTVGYFDPFVFLDHFGPLTTGPDGLGVPPHPHAGIATITYLFSGSNRHQDSLGHDVVIQKGDLAWMQAGKGIVHAEGMNENRTEPEIIHGLQLWISLPAKDKFIDPSFSHYDKSVMPEFDKDGVYYKVISGSLHGLSSPVKSLSPAYIYELKIPAGKSVELPVNIGDTCGSYLISGSLKVDGHSLSPAEMTKYDEVENNLTLTAESDAHVIILGGKPLNEPIYAYASFVMNTEEQIHQVIRDYQTGKMGTVKL